MEDRIKLSIQSDFANGSRLMGIIRMHLMIYFLECVIWQKVSYVTGVKKPTFI